MIMKIIIIRDIGERRARDIWYWTVTRCARVCSIRWDAAAYVARCHAASHHVAPLTRKGGRYGWKTSSSSNVSIRAFRAQIVQFELFELIVLLLKFDKWFPAEQFEATASQSASPSLLRRTRSRSTSMYFYTCLDISLSLYIYIHIYLIYIYIFRYIPFLYISILTHSLTPSAPPRGSSRPWWRRSGWRPRPGTSSSSSSRPYKCMCIYIYIYMYNCICMYVYIYICIYLWGLEQRGKNGNHNTWISVVIWKVSSDSSGELSIGNFQKNPLEKWQSFGQLCFRLHPGPGSREPDPNPPVYGQFAWDESFFRRLSQNTSKNEL